MKLKNSRWVKLGAGVALICLGFLLGSLWGQHRDNVLLALGVVIMLPAGGFLIYRGMKKTEAEVVIVSDKAKPCGAVNSLNIYARLDKATGQLTPEKVAFELVEKPLGQPWQCTNDGKWYHVHIFDIAKRQLKPFALPDSQYLDPREFANVIKMPAHRRLFERHPSLLQKLAPWALVVAFLIAIFGLVVTTPS